MDINNANELTITRHYNWCKMVVITGYLCTAHPKWWRMLFITDGKEPLL